jgi:kynureninase
VSDPPIRALFASAPGVTYLDAATYGSLPAPAVDATERAVSGWRPGTARWEAIQPFRRESERWSA